MKAKKSKKAKAKLTTAKKSRPTSSKNYFVVVDNSNAPDDIWHPGLEKTELSGPLSEAQVLTMVENKRAAGYKKDMITIIQGKKVNYKVKLG